MPELHADGALWGRARKGWFSGTRVRFSMESCPKRDCFGHGCTFFCPAVHKCPARGCRLSEVRKAAVYLCRTSIGSRGLMAINSRGAERIIKIFSHLCLIANRDFTLTLNWGGVSIINSVSMDITCKLRVCVPRISSALLRL